MDSKSSSYLHYNGHGMVDRYPKNMALAYVTAHERRHKVHNQLTAISTGETTEQSISYKVTLSSDGVPVVTSAATGAQSHKRQKATLSKYSNSNNFLSKGDMRNIQDISNAKRNSDRVNQMLRDVKSRDHMQSPFSPQTKAGTSLQETRLRSEAAAIQASLKKLKSTIQKKEFMSELTGGVRSTPTSPLPSETKNNGKKLHHAPKTKEDHITLREFDQAFVNSFRFMQNDVPGVTLNDGVGSALQMKQTLKKLKEPEQDTFLHNNFKFKSNFINLRNRELSKLSSRLSTLDSVATALSNNEKLNTTKSTSSNPSIVTVKPSYNTPSGSYSIQVSDVARGGTTVSSEVSDPFAALGFEGDFLVNGYTISVVTSDSLNNIKDKINFGEDTNKNGTLDFAEDQNRNNIIDTTYIRGVQSREGFTGSFYLSEDINFNNVLDVSEDLNDNKFLDGGSVRIGVTATLERNRLVLQNNFSANVQLQDTDGVLNSLGFFANDEKGVSVQSTIQLTQKGANLNLSRKKARIVVNDKVYKRNSNTINDIIPDATISINKSSSLSANVSIKKDFLTTVNLMNQFKKSYNTVITMANNLELSNAMLNSDAKTQGIRNNLVNTITKRVENTPLKKGLLSEIGIEMKNRKRSVNQNALSQLESRVKRDIHIGVANARGGVNTIRGALEKGGVSSPENNTLHIDNTKLLASFRRNLNGSSQIITGSNGLSQRIREITASALNSQSGSIQIHKDIAASYAETEKMSQNERNDRISNLSNALNDSISNVILQGGITI